MTESYLSALFGGVLIGLAAAGMLWSNGKILGVSGIIGGIFRSKSWDFYWRISFIVGLLLGALLIEPLGYSIMQLEIDRSIFMTGLGGLLVGFGTTIGNGCTSGHGVCGISRFSSRSIVATLIFMFSGIFTVAILNYIAEVV